MSPTSAGYQTQTSPPGISAAGRCKLGSSNARECNHSRPEGKVAGAAEAAAAPGRAPHRREVRAAPRAGPRALRSLGDGPGIQLSQGDAPVADAAGAPLGSGRPPVGYLHPNRRAPGPSIRQQSAGCAACYAHLLSYQASRHNQGALCPGSFQGVPRSAIHGCSRRRLPRKEAFGHSAAAQPPWIPLQLL